MPLVLPAVPLGLDVVSEDSALSEGVITLLDEVWVRCLEWSEDCICGGKRVGCFLGKDDFGSVGDYISYKMIRIGDVILDLPSI